MKTYPLLQSQLGIFLECMSNPDMTKDNLPAVVPFSKKVNPDKLESALRRIIDTVPEIKTRFLIDDEGNPRQYSDASMVIPVTRRKMTEAEARDYIDNHFVRPYHMTDGEPLWRFEIIESEAHNYMLVECHHSVGDGLTLSPNMTINLIPAAYNGEELGVSTYGMYEYAEDEQTSFTTEAYQRAKEYYAEKFAGVDFTSLANNTSSPWGNSIRESAYIDQQEVDDWCKTQGTTSNLLFMAAFSYVLSQLSREEKVSYYTINHGRMDKRLMPAFGMFVKSTPVLADANPKQNVMDFIKSFRRELMSTIRYGVYPFSHFCSDLHMSPAISFGFQGVSMQENIFIEGENTVATQLPKGRSDADLTCIIYLREGKYDIRLDASDALYSPQKLRQIADAVLAATVNMMAHPEAALSDIAIVTEQQEAELMKLSTGKHLEVDIKKTFVEAFVERAALCPEAPAVVDVNSQFTYSQLDRGSNILSHILTDNGVKPNSFVCVMLDRRKEFPLSVIAIHKAGAAYTPLDFEYPNERLSYMIENSQSKVLITTHDVLAAKQAEGDLATGDAKLIFIDDIDFADTKLNAEPVNHTTPDHLAYMIYTSGSTGKPKGAMLHQAGLWNFINVVIDMEKLTAEDRIEGHRSFSFDAHIEDMYAILTLGGSFHIMPSEIRKDLQAMHDFIIEHKITGGGYSTAIGALLLNTFDDLPVRFITAGGEKLDGVYSDHIEIINVYGPTECTDDTSYYSIKPGERVENIPIGKSVANNWNFIVSPTGQLVPPGMAGELCFAGIQVGRGYWQLPERTEQVFCDCPFIKEDAWGRKVRMYHTGDLCRWNEQGDLEFLGRIDFQVKLRGFRIELGEIESKVLCMEGIRQTVAEVKKINGIDHLLLYYTLENGSTMTEDDIRQALEASSLAEYMVPDTYVQMETMPLTPNGKVNRKALPIPEIKSTIEYVEPANDTERIIAETFKEVLKVENPIGALNSFFEYGGDSIKAIRLVSVLRSKGIVVTVATVMKEKTVRAIAATVEQETKIEINQSNWSGWVENSAIEQFFFDLKLPVPHHYNQSIMLRALKRLDKGILKNALETVTTQHDMLRAVVRDGKLFVRPIGDGAMATIDEFTIDEQDKASINLISNNIESSIDIENGPLMKVALLHGTETDYLLLVIHHTVIDGVSWLILLEDLSTAYGQTMEGLPVRLPAKTHSYKYYQEAMERFKKSRILAAEKDYWEKVRAEVADTATSAGNDYSRHFSRQETVISADVAETLLDVPKHLENVNMNDLLLTSLLRSYAAVTGKKKMSVLLEGHGRENIGEPLHIERTVGWFTSMCPVVLHQHSDDLLDNLVSVKDVLHRVPNNGIGYGQLFGMDVTTMPQVTFNYLGGFERSKSGESPLTIAEGIPVGDMVAKANSYGSDITINCMVLPSGKFLISLDYNEDILTQAQAAELLQRIEIEIKEITQFRIQEADLLTVSDLGETSWTREEFETIAAEFAERDEKLRRIYPLTPMQEGMVLKAVMEPDSVAYRIVFALEMGTLPTEQQLRHTLDHLALRHEVLRTAVIYRGVSQYRQAIVEGRRLGLIMKDITTVDDKTKAITNTRKELLQTAFDLQSKPLFNLVCIKTSDSTCTLLLAFHHIIEDGWCLPIIQKDLFTILADEMAGKPANVVSAGEGRYEKYIRDLLLKDKEASLNYWRGLLEGYESKAVIPSFGDIEEEKRTVKDSLMVEITPKEQKQLINLCNTIQVTPNTVVELAWGILLQKYNRTSDAVFAKIISGRDNTIEDVSDVIGIFINAVPVRVKADDKDTVADSLKKVQAQAAETNQHDYLSMSEVQQQSSLGTELYQSTIIFENYPTEYENPWPFSLKPVITKEENFDDITLVVYLSQDGRLALELKFNNHKYTEKMASDVLKALHHLIHGMLENTDAKVLSLPLLDDEALKEVVQMSAGVRRKYDFSKTYMDHFLERAAQCPDCLAVADGHSEITYSQLNRYSDLIAQKLISLGVKKHDFIGVMIERSKEFPVCVFGIHKAGGAYLPLDIEYPNERLQYMLEDSEASVLITTHEVLEAKRKEGDFRADTIIFIDEIDWEKESATAKPVNRCTPDCYTYIIYTSGSTGKPKGVVLHHKGLLNYIFSTIEELNLTAADRISSHRSFSFDSHIEDLYAILLLGGSLHIMPEEIRKNLQAIRDFVVEHQITGGGYTTSIATMLVNTFDMPVRYLSAIGEKLVGVVSREAQIINAYGPTECTDHISIYYLEKDKEYRDIPIGHVIANSWCFIVDSSGQLAPLGACGELCIAGIQVGIGYWHLPERTAQSFVECPFVDNNIDGTPVRMYHTGDLARFNEDGELVCLGRIDNQVKLRGYRVELGEIETEAMKVDGIQQAIAMIRDINHDKHLVLYYTVDEGKQVEEETIDTFMRHSKLPSYMVPEVYMFMEAMPRTPNGKVDRRNLPEPKFQLKDVVAPETDTEKKLFEIAVEALKHDQFGVTTNLITLGLTSLSAMQLSTILQQRLEKLVPVQQILSKPTLREIAEYIDSGEAKSMKKAAIFTKREAPENTESEKPKANPFAPKKENPFAPKKNPFAPKK